MARPITRHHRRSTAQECFLTDGTHLPQGDSEYTVYQITIGMIAKIGPAMVLFLSMRGSRLGAVALFPDQLRDLMHGINLILRQSASIVWRKI